MYVHNTAGHAMQPIIDVKTRRLFIPRALGPPRGFFVMNLIAIVPLSITLTLATEQLSHDLGETTGALLNITIGNLAELIIL